MSAIALAWLRGHGEIPIASARTVEQLKEITPIIELTPAELQELDSVSSKLL
jgi:aryl-alcohol dehydrogenase-like predicted oxidoreductase